MIYSRECIIGGSEQTQKQQRHPPANTKTKWALHGQGAHYATQHMQQMKNKQSPPTNVPQPSSSKMPMMILAISKNTPTNAVPKRWVATYGSSTFLPLQCTIYSIIDTWSKNTTAIMHPMYQEWTTWTNKGIKESSPYPTIKQILNISSLAEYITSVQRCPAIKQNLTLWWNNAQTWIIYFLNNTILQETRNPTHQYNTQSQINKTQKQDNISNPGDDDTHTWPLIQTMMELTIHFML